MKTRFLISALALCALTLFFSTPAQAGSATWSGQLNSNWNVFQNWSPINPFFAVNYGITVSPALTLTISGTGITNNSGQAQNFVVAASDGMVGEAELFFTNSATAGSAIFTNNTPPVAGVDGGVTIFFDSSSAGNSLSLTTPAEKSSFGTPRARAVALSPTTAVVLGFSAAT